MNTFERRKLDNFSNSEETREEGEKEGSHVQEKEKENENAPLSNFEVIEVFTPKKVNIIFKLKTYFSILLFFFIFLIPVILLNILEVKINIKQIPHFSKLQKNTSDNYINLYGNLNNITNRTEIIKIANRTYSNIENNELNETNITSTD